MNYPTLTKNKIEKIARKILDVLEKKQLANDLCIYFNNKRIIVTGKYDKSIDAYVYEETIEDDINPLNYLKYSPSNHIISISTEGELYDILNYGSCTFPKTLENLFKENGIYWELGESWNLSFFAIDENMSVEYTTYETFKSKEPKILHYYCKDDYSAEIKEIMENWYRLSSFSEDVGCCVLGAGIEFDYNEEKYKMLPCSPYQGEGSWTPYLNFIIHQLEKIGATNIKYNYGIMD